MRLNRGVSFVTGLMAPPAATLVCRRCSQRVKRLGFVALAGMLAICLFMVLLLHFASNFL